MTFLRSIYLLDLTLSQQRDMLTGKFSIFGKVKSPLFHWDNQ